MAKEYDNSGVLFKNDRKEKESHPDHNGELTVNGVKFWLSAWVKQGAKGPFLSLAVKPKDTAAPTATPQQATKPDYPF